MRYILLLIACWCTATLTAQTNLKLQNGTTIKINGDVDMVLENTNFANNGTFTATDGTVYVRGNSASSYLGGLPTTTFNNLVINKTTNDVALDGDVNIVNELTLTNGDIDIYVWDLIILPSGSILGGSTNSYIKTTVHGTLTQEVGNSNVTFPIGNQSYTPVILNNVGTTDDYSVRVENVVYENGTSGNAITSDIVKATWYIDEATANGSDVTATFQWNTSDELTGFDRTQAYVSHYHTSQWNKYASQSASGSNPYTVSQSGITTFSPFTVASNSAALPVELLYFYAEKVKEGVLLSWETTTEISNDYFDVEWSKDGIHFDKIGKVVGVGTTNEVSNYEFIDEQPIEGVNYYRLRQVDNDGQFEYSKTVTAEIRNRTSEITIYPNPVSSNLTIENGEGMITIFNTLGQVIRQFENNERHTTIDVSSLAVGQYFIHIQKESGDSITKKIMK